MTKMHFQMLADEMRQGKPAPSDVQGGVQWCRDAYALARVCARCNARFDQGRFLTACGISPEDQ